ncbi:D-alanyl-D-alanine carboxypeptidase family protein [Gracilinema caldarium]|uniref:Serine-type D-Ala-D-Ala carboxypeptidase n=1 Tax=Gracilinema caldarium (strain ATCC 51460 / DSM 7334 / H1) TaxID=744872 RepID=F8F0R5_GRAC1|nr:D-alanyl-D-alanine carboxypeptidase family protein [Gracilinema caldarium]AEJ19772.1 Serine-type D-Ala-D-Ala carboxypeptidase [Gracilinema caldarium DSM 7334]
MQRQFFLLLLVIIPGLLLVAEDLEIHSRSAILLDASTGTVLFEKNADEPIPPASLTKLVTMHIAFQDIAMGKVHLDDIVPIPRAAWAINQSWGSSLMFLGPGQRVTLRELLLGLAVCSGNDAAVAIALYLAPSIEVFAERMNQEVQRLGLTHTHFVEPSGISEHNVTTARDFAAFCRFYIAEHPDAITNFHAVREFAYPKAENVPETYRDNPRTIVQSNRNTLLDTLEGVDGLKTGYIIESGYNIALTAKRGDTRFLAVLLGGPGRSSLQGGQIRAEDGTKLLEWAFANYKTLHLSPIPLPQPRIWKGTLNKTNLHIADAVIDRNTNMLSFTTSIHRGIKLNQNIEIFEPVVAPIQVGTIIGRLIISDNEGTLQQFPLTVDETIPKGNLIKRMIDALILCFIAFFKNIGLT